MDETQEKRVDEETYVLSQTPVAGSADAPLQSRRDLEPALVLVQGDLARIVFRLSPGRNTIGRDAECTVRLPHRMVSHVHAEIVLAEAHAVLRDAGSKNGTLLNGVRLREPTLLKAGHVISIGPCNFKYEDRKLDVEFIESLHLLGTRDALTGTASKAHITRLLEDALAVVPTGGSVAIILLDFDFFKRVNDLYGHMAGDHVLKEAARVIRERAIRQEDALGRFGGEEFAVLLPDTSLADAVKAAERIRTVIEAHNFEFEGEILKMTASFGVCSSSAELQKASDLIRIADALLYRSKREGRNRVSFPDANGFI